MNAVITGGGGFIGTNLLHYRKFIDYFDEIVVVDKTISRHRARPVEANVTYLECDYLEMTAHVAIESADVIIHLAGQVDVQTSIEDPQGDVADNVTWPLIMLEGIRKRKKQPRLILVSSGAAEASLSPYGASKRAMEGYATAYTKCYGMSIATLRFANVYGPHSQGKESFLAKAIRAAAKGEVLTIHGSGEQRRDFIHSTDICSAILTAAATGHDGTFYVGKGHTHNLLDCVEILRDLVEDVKVEHGPPINGEPMDIVKLPPKYPTWFYRVDLERGINDCVRWYEETTKGGIDHPI